MKPTYPETGYGYIECRNPKLNVPTKSLGFREKPKYEIAKEYFESGNYLWNSGMFIFRYDVIMEALKKYKVGHFNTINKITKIIIVNVFFLSILFNLFKLIFSFISIFHHH